MKDWLRGMDTLRGGLGQRTCPVRTACVRMTSCEDSLRGAPVAPYGQSAGRTCVEYLRVMDNLRGGLVAR